MSAVNVLALQETQDFGSNQSYSFHSKSLFSIATRTASYANNPNWRVKVKTGQDAGSPYNIAWADNPTPGVMRARDHLIGGSLKTYGTTVFYGNLSVPGYQTNVALSNQALGKVKNRIANSSDEFKALAPLAELGEVRGMVKSVALTALEMVHGLVDLKHGNVRDAARRAGDIWLNFNFGVAPTIKDIQDANKAIHKHLTRSATKPLIYAGSASTDYRDQPFADASYYCAGYTKSKVRHSVSHSLSYKYVVMYKIHMSNEVDYNSLSHFGLSAQDIIPAAWELVPFSWVVDYFTNVGKVLEDRFYAPAGQSVYAYRNINHRWHYLAQPLGATSDAFSAFDSFSGSPATCSGGHFSREVLTSLPSRELAFNSVDQTGLNAVSKLLNLASILVK